MGKGINDLELEKFDGRAVRVHVVIRALAVDGVNAGEYVEIGASYNATTGNYELLTAGSGSSSSASGLLLQDGTSALLLQDGTSQLLLQTG